MKTRYLIPYLKQRLRREQRAATPAEVYTQLIDYLISEGYRLADADPQEHRALLVMRGARVRWTTALRVWEPLPVVTVLSRLDNRIPEGHRLLVLSRLNRINCNSKLFGNWEMSLDDGHLYYRTSGVVRSLAGARDVFRDLIDCNHVSVDADLPDMLPDHDDRLTEIDDGAPMGGAVH